MHRRRYHADVVARCGIAIFIAGTSRRAEASRGVLEEYEIAEQLGKVVIPIGATGFAARRIWTTMAHDVDKAYGGAVPEALFARLGGVPVGRDYEPLLRSVFDIMRRVSDT